MPADPLTRVQKIHAGLSLIIAKEPDAGFAAEHDIIYCGTPSLYSAEEKATLEDLGWLVDERMESFLHFA